MSTFGRQFTDAALTNTLDHWLDEGPTSAPDTTVEAALRTVATTRQRQLRGRLLRMADFHGPVVPVSLTLAGITAVVLVAIGLGLNNEPVPGVEDSPPPGVPTEEPVPTDIPYGYVMFRNETDGYEIAIPRTWEVQIEPAYGEPHPGVTRFGTGDEERPPLVVSVGTASGSVFLCQGLICTPEVARSLDEIEGDIRSDWPLPTGAMPEISIDERIVSTTLGGEPARFRYPTNPQNRTILGFTTTCSAYALHAGRPVVLSFPCGRFFSRSQDGGEPAGLGQLEAIIASFRFLDESTDAGRQDLTFQEAGFAVAVPDWWIVEDHDPYVHSASAPFRPGTVLVIRSGDEQNRMHAWGLAAEPRRADSHRALLTILAREYREHAGNASHFPTTRSGDLAGTPATWVVYGTGPNGGPIERHVVAIHGGRPFIVSWLGADADAQTLRGLLATFRFLD